MLSVCFVDADAAGGGDGQSWASAYQDLQAALDYAEAVNSDAIGENDVDQIWIAEGVYRPDEEQYEDGYWWKAHFGLLDGVGLYGGFEGSEEALGERDWESHETILSGDRGSYDSYRTIVMCESGVEAILNGIVVERGRAASYATEENPEWASGAGVFNGGTLTIENCTIRENEAWVAGGGIFNSGILEVIRSTIAENQSHDDGGGIYSTGSLTITDSVVHGNSAGTTTVADDDGGGIYSTGSLTITDSSITRNTANSDGGGVFSDGGDVILSNAVVNQNTAVEHGGGVFIDGVEVLLSDTVVNQNTAGGDGGGVFVDADEVSLSNLVVKRNMAGGYGGGIRVCANGDIGLTDSTVSENRATTGGGIFTCDDTTLNVAGSAIHHNWASEAGGGISVGGNASLSGVSLYGNTAGTDGGGMTVADTATVTTSTIAKNEAAANGGGIFNGIAGTITVTNSTLARNSAGGDGGGFFSNGISAGATFNNSIIAENTADSGPDMYLILGTFAGSNNLIGNRLGQIVFADGVDGNLVGAPDAPLDPLLSELSQFATESWGYYLLPGSPALDAGDTDLAVDPSDAPLETDQAGETRIQGDTVDMGAVEGMHTRAAQTYVVTSLADVIDAGDGELTLREAFQATQTNLTTGDAPGGSFEEPDLIQFAEGVRGTFFLNGEALRIVTGVTIEGPGADLVSIDAGGASRGLVIDAGVSCTLGGLSIAGGFSDIGGGVYNSGSLFLAGMAVVDNESSGRGGGIYNASRGVLSAEATDISGNAAAEEGGGIFNDGVMTLNGSSVHDNSAAHGGGIGQDHTAEGAGLAAINSFISRNTATYQGGGIYGDYGRINLVNSTVNLNEAATGGGLFLSGDIHSINNSVIAQNVAEDGPDVFENGITFSGANNLIGDGSELESVGDGMDENMVGTEKDPIDPLLSNWTQFDNGVWGCYPRAGSPILDAGDNAIAVDDQGIPLAEDILGSARISGDAVDLGPVEGVSTRLPQTYIVTSLSEVIDANDGELTLFEALEASNRNQPVGDAPGGSFSDQDVIQFAQGLAGTVLLNGEAIDIYGDLSLEGPGADVLTFDAQGASRVFHFAPHLNSALSGMTITGGSATEGAGVYSTLGSLAIRDTRIVDNHADTLGGGIFSDSGELWLEEVTLANNTATHGAGLYFTLGELTVLNSHFLRNSIYDETAIGGGIYLSGGVCTIYGSVFQGNVASSNVSYHQGYGGGIFSFHVDLTIIDSEFSGNVANGWDRLGGGIAFFYGELTVQNSTLSANRHDNVFARNAELLIQNSVMGPEALGGSDLVLDDSTLSGSHNIISNGTGQTDLVDGVDGNIVGTSTDPIDPLFYQNPDPGPDGLWGTEDDDYGDLRLQIDSPGIDAGDTALLPTDLFDADGDGDTSEPLSGDIASLARVVGDSVDIGAHESPCGIHMRADEQYEGNGGSSTLRFVVSVYPAPATDIQVDYATSDISTTAGEDYTAVAGTLTIMAGDTYGWIDVPVNPDYAVEPDVETFLMTLSNPSGAVIVDDEVEGVLLDDDGYSYIVDSTADIVEADGVLTLREALEAATFNRVAGDAPAGVLGPRVDHIFLAPALFQAGPATILVESGELAFGSDVTLCGPDADSLILDAQGQSTVVYTTGTGIVISDVTITGGFSSENGGGIRNHGELTLRNVVVEQNSAVNGGGIYCDYAADLTILDSVIQSNTATNGGGIYSYERYERGAKATIVGSTVRGNSAVNGGGIYNDGNAGSATLEVIDSVLSGNSAMSGGAIYNRAGEGVASTTLIGSTVFENTASILGGGIYNDGTTGTVSVSVANSRFYGNSAEVLGGGIYATGPSDNASVNVTGTLLVGNSAASGAGIHSSGALAIANSTLVENLAIQDGGGINSLGVANIDNSVIANNTAGFSGPDIYALGTLYGSHTFVGIGSGQTALVDGEAGNLVGTESTPRDPLFVRDPDPGSDRFWATGDEDYGDLRLRHDSEAIDAGDDAALPADAHDLDGDEKFEEPLPVDLSDRARVWGDSVDMGAFEMLPGIYINSVRSHEWDSGNSVMRFAVSVYPAQAEDLTIEYATSDLTALSDTDYEAVSGTLTIPAGQNVGYIDVILFGNTAAESNRDFALNLTGSSGPTILDSIATGTILDDDGRTYVVDSLADTVASDGVLTLREALEAANTNAASGDALAGKPGLAADHIVFDSGLFTEGPASIVLSEGELAISGNVTISGPATDVLTIDADRQSRVFGIHSGVLAVLGRLNITGGDTSGNGGGIVNEGALVLVDSSVFGNDAACGGGIYTGSTMWPTALTAVNSTIIGNTGTNGGGIYSIPFNNHAEVLLANCTITKNTAAEAGGGFNSAGFDSVTANSGMEFYNTIIADNQARLVGDDVRDLWSRIGGANNLIGVSSRQLGLIDGVDGNLVGSPESPIVPMLSDWTRLANGQWGYYLLPGSPALDAGDNTFAVDHQGIPLASDVQGNARVQSGTVDIGAVEGVTDGTAGQVYVVTSLDDVIDPSDSVLTFAEAFAAANENRAIGDAAAGSSSETDVIRFADGLEGAIVLDGQILSVLGALAIEGPGAHLLTFDADDQSGVFSIRPGATAALSGVTITGGFAQQGGGLRNAGDLELTNVTIAENTAASGGGMYNIETVSLLNTTIIGNTATGSVGGGGVYNAGEFNAANTTVWGNRTTAANADGGGIRNDGSRGSAVCSLVNTTVSGNSTLGSGGGLYSVGTSAAAQLHNSIVAGNSAFGTGMEIYSSNTLTGTHTLVGRGDGQTTLIHGEEGNLVGSLESPIDPLLSDITQFENGLWGYFLRSGSPAVDAGDNALSVDTEGGPLGGDIYGNTRIQSGTVDLGSVEGTVEDIAPQTYVVTSLANVVDPNDGELTFIEAFEAASRNQPIGSAPGGSYTAPDVIQFAEGIGGLIPLSGTPLTPAGSLIIEGPGADLLKLDAQHRSGAIFVPAAVSLTISGVTITGGTAEYGAGITNFGVTDFSDITFSKNWAISDATARGGVVFNVGTMTVADSLFQENTAGRGQGGAVYNGGTLVILDSVLQGNRAIEGRGGAVYNSGNLTIEESRLEGNLATEGEGRGGAIYNCGTLAISDSTLLKNKASRAGGAIYGESGTVTLTDSTVSENSVLDSFQTADGGGIHNSGEMLLVNATISDNSATRYGGGVCNTGSITVDGSTITENEGRYGAGFSSQGSMTLAHSTIVGNSGASSGGGIYVLSGNLKIADSTISEHSVSLDGGGICLEHGTAHVSGSTVEGNDTRMRNGGGVYVGLSATLQFVDSIARGNVADDEGGGIYSEGSVTIADSSFFRNVAPDGGGGVYNSEGTLHVVSSLFAGNSAPEGLGGGVISNHATLTVMNSIFCGNQAYHGGGGVLVSGTGVITNSTLTKNWVDTEGSGRYYGGAGIYNSNSLVLDNSIVAGNIADDGFPPDIRNRDTLTASHNLIGADIEDSGLVDGVEGNIVGTLENPVDPLFVRDPHPGEDGVWGTEDDDYGNLRLRPQSPALDAGSNDSLPADTFDLDGDSDVDEPIPFDIAGAPRIIGSAVDMGAYESLPGDLDGDGMVNTSDLDLVRAHWGQAVTPGDGPSGDASWDGLVNTDDLDLVRANWGSGTPTAAAVDAVFGTGQDAQEEPTDTLAAPFDAESARFYGPLPKEAVTAERGSRHSRDEIVAAAVEAWMRELEGRTERQWPADWRLQ